MSGHIVTLHHRDCPHLSPEPPAPSHNQCNMTNALLKIERLEHRRYLFMEQISSHLKVFLSVIRSYKFYFYFLNHPYIQYSSFSRHCRLSKSGIFLVKILTGAAIFGSDANSIRNLCGPAGVRVCVCMCVCVSAPQPKTQDRYKENRS